MLQPPSSYPSDKARHRIANAKKQGKTKLDLSNLHLTELPSEIISLTALRVLDLSGNQLTELPPEIGSLTALQTLYLGDNQLTELPPEIGSLTALQTLYLGDNQLTELPPEIGSLTALKFLDLGGNQLTKLPPEIGSLTALQTLHLRGNQLTELPPEIGSLTALEWLDLSGNQLTELPPEIGSLTALEWLFLHDNPELGLPPEVLGPTLSDVTERNAKSKPPREILDYYFRIAEAGEALQECKLIVVGRGGAGKTTLVKRLNRIARDPNEKETHGITITNLEFDCPGGAVKARVWDFGGQVVLHSMHEFFLTARSLYLLVLGERDDMLERDAEYWLQLIRSYAGNVPVVVALNKSEGRNRQFDRATLEEKYGPILAWISTECACEPDEQAGIAALRGALTDALNTEHMDSVRRKFPRQWSSIKSKLEGMTESFLDYPKYQALCALHGEKDSRAQESLSADLHDLGVALNYSRDPRLHETSILRPDWLANGIYAILRANELDNKLPEPFNGKLAPDGRITLESLELIYEKAENWGMLKRVDYPADKRQFLLRLMDAFHLSYPLDEENKVHLVPTLLELNPPNGSDEPTDADAVRLRYEFQVVPAPLIPWFIARTFTLIPDNLHWRRGAVLVFGDSRARVWATQDERYVFVTAVGPSGDRDDLVMMIRGTFKSLFLGYRGLRVVEQHDYNGSWVPRKALEDMGILLQEPTPGYDATEGTFDQQEDDG
ncbi:MAG: leucine-rich repeat domain-containing protein [Planctomycetes bacterium]|nr:leucine-rich repeat domain-containing protein [Planctomycetota bacterium]